MTQITDIQEAVTQHHTVLFGVENNGGLLRDVQAVKVMVENHEKRLNLVSLKWMILMLLAGAVGNSAGSALLQTLLP